ncbi:MAG: 3-oxoacyl-ACP reductase FabG [Oscillospiraceae bacterium]|nr:3-oxoacyl-ACP reductase FabG [Oscillospiraceae bacterium]MBQ4118007.1 3-oxoacyl-ACP reductase FabG [Oscillospiraceae bacterium]MBQ6802086.1 3-oxoacyl-ACP reductase FabG [Oscillospiraceae bacterium]
MYFLKGGVFLAKVVLVTGGSRGIGKAVCEKFAAEGYTVAVNFEKSEEKAAALAQKIGGRAYKADVSDYGEVCAMFEKIEAELGEVSVLINNAGISLFGLFQDCTDEEWERVFGVNVKGVFNCSKRAIGNMIKRQSGSIVNISSIWGVTGGSCECHYSAAKAAVIGYTKSMAKELGPSGIRVNCVAPGAVETDMNARFSKEELEAVAEESVLGYIAKPKEIAEAVFFAASEKASYMTGAVINVNGGSVI